MRKKKFKFSIDSSKNLFAFLFRVTHAIKGKNIYIQSSSDFIF